ncbi:MAG: hypothetical protein HYS17_11455 [Micavibrio aeruginosavorus]|uniref:Uncharacterized protein n=1 Tax=Micavibrio aeruginosavorus TaxID=349221 RepID=A0A7T5R238_9BACT|nr:MAG: hypothetical protein HYS17_11455 [Micavibrio aeruginosavorus]
MPDDDKPKGLIDLFKTKAVAHKGPQVCEQLRQALTTLKSQHSEDGTPTGRPRDVRAYIALEAIGRRVDTFRDTIQQGGVRGYEKMKEARTYLSRLQRYGLEA